MKKIVILSGIIMATLVSCSTEDDQNHNQTYNQNVSKTVLSTQNRSNSCVTCRDSIYKLSDSISEPIKPKKD